MKRFKHKPWKSRDSWEAESRDGNQPARMWVQMSPNDNGRVTLSYSDSGDEDCSIPVILERDTLWELILLLFQAFMFGKLMGDGEEDEEIQEE